MTEWDSAKIREIWERLAAPWDQNRELIWSFSRLAVFAISARDFPVVQGTVLIIAVLFVLVNLAVDVLYAYVDPRIHYA